MAYPLFNNDHDPDLVPPRRALALNVPSGGPFRSHTILSGITFPGISQGLLEWGPLYLEANPTVKGWIRYALLCSVVLFDSSWKDRSNQADARALRPLRKEYEGLASALTTLELNMSNDFDMRRVLGMAQAHFHRIAALLAAAENALLGLYNRAYDHPEWHSLTGNNFAHSLSQQLKIENADLLLERTKQLLPTFNQQASEAFRGIEAALAKQVYSLTNEWKVVLQRQVDRYVLGTWLTEIYHPHEWVRRMADASEPSRWLRFRGRLSKIGRLGRASERAEELAHHNEREQHRLERKAVQLGFI